MYLQERQVLPEKSEVLYGTMPGDFTGKAYEDEEMETDELGTRMVEHGQRVSRTNLPRFSPILIPEAVLYCG